MPSMVNAVAMTTVSTPLISPSFVVPSSLAVSSFCVALRWWFTAKAMSEANVMTPKPPICTEKMSTAWPKADQCVVELTMEMPHVEIAEIAVKNAVVNVVCSSFGVAAGVSRSSVDNAPRSVKYRMVRRPGCVVSLCIRLRLRGLRSSAMAFSNVSPENHQA